MKNMRWIFLLVALCYCLAISVSADDGNFGEVDIFGSTEATTTDPGEQTTEPAISGTEGPTTAPTTEPATSNTEPTTEPESSTSETTPPEESVSGEETSEPAETETEPDEGTTERPDVQTTEPTESPSESVTSSENERPDESETQPEQGASMPISLPIILAGLGVLAVGCVAVVVVVMIKYFRAQKA